LVGDLLAGRASTELGKVEPSYRPGVTLCDIREILPDFVTNIIKRAIPRINREIPGFDRHDAVLTAVETRSSSPLRITRDNKTLESENTPGLYPAGEGAGYAGGIVSAAADGLKVAEAILNQ
ncbi:MAG: putative FAD-dependent dehydrogenase, partial [Verrucomicrobiales bacterium]